MLSPGRGAANGAGRSLCEKQSAPRLRCAK